VIRDDEIFAEALDLPTVDRIALLDRSCGHDSTRRARIEALLAAYETVGDFLERSPIVRAAPPIEADTGDTIGRYTLLRKIGEGGWGTVYLAEQKIPVRRRVALKIIKLGMDTRQVIARFEGERQALAMMDHADIARVFDAGATDTGRPFFVMEFVEGVPITKFCDERTLNLAARLELFARVCLALQHAHRKGIIHRDIKPSNILVALHDGVPTPKVIDFGIAKATQDPLTDHTLFTGVGQFIGTPAYMSPEQADLRDPDIDTRSDIYALGVLLYELLASQPPFEPKQLAQAGVDEIRRLIREVEPPRPSARVTTLSEQARGAAARARGLSTAQYLSALRGDLDWIAMRCIEKNRDRRYGSAQELADDIRRHLRREPVEARPPSTLYRTQKFVARHRLACASGAAVASALVIGTVVSVRQAIRATRAEHAARAERDVATAAGLAEARARADAQRRQQQAEDLLTFMLGDFRTELQKIGRLHLLDAVGEKAMDYFAALDPRDLTDTALARQTKALTQIGEIRMDQARYADASAAFSTAYARAAALAARYPANGDMLFERGQAEYWIGFVARTRGDFAAAREWLTRYRDSALALEAIEGKTLRAQTELTYGHHNLAVLEFDQGNLADARRGFLAEKTAVEEMLVANPDDAELQFSLADIASWLGSAAEADGDYPEALERFAEMTSRAEKLIAREPDVARWRFTLAQSRTLTGIVQTLLGRRTDAFATHAQAEALLAELTAQDPKNQEWQLALLNSRILKASLLLADGNIPEAANIIDASRRSLEHLVDLEPSSHYFVGQLATAWRLESRLRADAGRPHASEAMQRSIDLGETLVAETKANGTAISGLAQANVFAGRLASERSESDVAQRYWNRALEVLAPRLPNSNDWRFLDPAAHALVLLGRTEEACTFIERLRRFDYHAIDPLAASLLDTAPCRPTSTLKE
jgi:serine/threonine protein kinase/tetratricopeptide (TPR) repeat protein